MNFLNIRFKIIKWKILTLFVGREQWVWLLRPLLTHSPCNEAAPDQLSETILQKIFLNIFEVTERVYTKLVSRDRGKSSFWFLLLLWVECKTISIIDIWFTKEASKFSLTLTISYKRNLLWNVTSFSFESAGSYEIFFPVTYIISCLWFQFREFWHKNVEIF